ncbi:MAG: glycosyltransferase family 2 protein [Candidatus Latescibacteria bacterium]|nr:glycosyltransferase family 2 protein [Candidatus Latescibacterota bacterium]MBT4137085.1 glycosyltransferase family 2 protein [Candidatus Latescibacterota bacterium]
MKLIVQIPCLNEEDTLPATVKDIPREVPGIDKVEILIIDDGSTDRTVKVARELGVDHIVKFPKNRGLGYAFKAGFDACLKLGADIIINTDGDNQYYGPDIEVLVKPILEHRAHIVIGDRQTGAIGHFSFMKRFLQNFGSKMISRLAHIDVPDVASGFRAYSREAALHLSMFTDFDHTAEHVVQAGQDRLAVEIVPIRTNPKTRESRLFKNVGEFVFKSGMISMRTYARYNALRIFSAFGSMAFGLGFILGLRFVYIFFAMPDESALHVQSLILAAILLLAGFQMFLTGIVADLIATNRALLEDVSTRVRRLELKDRETE